jgi:hypothetical protein
MKRALIVAAMGILASTGWAVSANAQADINSNLYPANRGAPAAQRGWEWEAAPGPNKRGGMCVPARVWFPVAMPGAQGDHSARDSPLSCKGRLTHSW